MVNKYPRTAEVLFKYGLHCLGCAVSEEETLEEGARAHGMTDEEIEKMVSEINKTLASKK